MFSIGASRTAASLLGQSNAPKDHLAPNRQLSTTTIPFPNPQLVYNQHKKFPEFKYPSLQSEPLSTSSAMKDITPTVVALHSSSPRNYNHYKKKSPSKTKKNRIMQEEIDEVGLDACFINETTPITPDITSTSTCPLKIKLTELFASSLLSCSPKKTTTSPNNNTASPKSTSSSPIELFHFTWWSTPKSCSISKFRKRLSSDCQSEDSFVIFTNDDDEMDELDSDCFTDDEDDSEDDEVYHDIVDRENLKKKVTFETRDKLCIVHPMVNWSYAYRSARKGHWEQLGRDRTRFQGRINNIAPTLNKILSSDHRNKIYHQRFESRTQLKNPGMDLYIL